MTLKVGGRRAAGLSISLLSFRDFHNRLQRLQRMVKKKRNYPVSCSCVEENAWLILEVRIGRLVEDHRKETGS